MKKNIKKILLIVYLNKFGVLNVQICKKKFNQKIKIKNQKIN